MEMSLLRKGLWNIRKAACYRQGPGAVQMGWNVCRSTIEATIGSRKTLTAAATSSKDPGASIILAFLINPNHWTFLSSSFVKERSKTVGLTVIGVFRFSNVFSIASANVLFDGEVLQEFIERPGGILGLVEKSLMHWRGCVFNVLRHYRIASR